MSWEKVCQHGSVMLKNKKGTSNATDMEAIITLCPKTASGMLFRIVVIPKSLGTFIVLVNVIPGLTG